jgi:hypothetical protein
MDQYRITRTAANGKPTEIEWQSVSYHLGGAPSVLNVGERIATATGHTLTVERITFLPGIGLVGAPDTIVTLCCTDETGREYQSTSTPGTILDHLYERRWRRIP